VTDKRFISISDRYLRCCYGLNVLLQIKVLNVKVLSGGGFRSWGLPMPQKWHEGI
jgi:hypothetical protein